VKSHAARFAWIAPAIVFAGALCGYLVTLAPTITWAHAGTDGGDLITAAATQGIPHPPGYPTYVLLGNLFARLPVGEVASRLHLMSAVSAALAAALIAASILRSASSPQPATLVGASIAGLTLAFGPMLWGQATIAEVHALNALCVAAIVFVAAPWVSMRHALKPAEKVALGFTWGLGLGNLPTIAALAPIALPALWLGAKGRWIGFAALAAGLCVYALIPMRAAAQPVINWGDARSAADMVWLVSGGLYRGYVLAAPLDTVVQRLLGLPRLWLQQMGWVGGVWVALGIAASLDSRRAAPVAVATFLYGAFAITYNTADSDLYLIPVWVLSAGYLGVGLATALESQASHMRRAMVGAVASLAVVAMIAGGWPKHDLSRDYSASAFAEDILSSLSPDAILLTHADAHTFTLWYYRLVRGWRKDVSIVDARLAGYAWYEPMLNAQGAAPRLPADRNEDGLVDRLAAANPARPVCELIPPPQDDHLSTLRCD
jgi:hypothetical protein